MSISRKSMIAVIVVTVFLSMIIGAYVVNPLYNAQNAPPPKTGALTMIITSDNWYNNSSGYQAAFFVVENGHIESSSMITAAAHTLLEITIMNYDKATDPLLVNNDANVTGTVGDVVYEYNNTLVNASGAGVISPRGEFVLTSVPASKISHTFTTNTGLNIPVYPSSTEVAYAYFNTTGLYTWACMCNCGPVAMDHSGWMFGDIQVVSQ